MLALTLLAIGALAVPALVHDKPAAAATDWGKALVNSTMARFPDARSLPWRYPRALFLYGQYQLYLRTGNLSYLNYLKRWAEAHVDDAGNMFFDAAHRDPVDLSAELDHLLPGRLMIILHSLTGQQKYRLAAQKLRQRFDVWPRTSDGGLWHRWSLTGQLWADGTYMALPFLIEYGRAYGDREYAENEAAQQLLIYGRHLQDTAAACFSTPTTRMAVSWANPTTLRSPEYWCRGMAWYGVALVEVLELLPTSHTSRAELLERLNRFATGIVRYQDGATGRWFEVVDKGNLADNWLETSCSAMFAYVLGRGIERGFIPASFHDAAARGYQGVLNTISKGTDGRTNLVETVIGTGVGDLAYYLARPRLTNDWHGLGAFMIMHEQFNKRPANAVTIWREAESGSPTAPLIVRTDAQGLGPPCRPDPRRGQQHRLGPFRGSATFQLLGAARRQLSDLGARDRADDWRQLVLAADRRRRPGGSGTASSWARVGIGSDVHTTATSGQTLLLNLSAGSPRRRHRLPRGWCSDRPDLGDERGDIRARWHGRLAGDLQTLWPAAATAGAGESGCRRSSPAACPLQPHSPCGA